MTGVGLLAGGVRSRWALGCVPYMWVVGAHCVSGRAFQVAQTARALHWIVKTLRASGFGSEVDVPTLGEWVARPAAGLHPPVFFWVWGQLGGEAAGGALARRKALAGARSQAWQGQRPQELSPPTNAGAEAPPDP